MKVNVVHALLFIFFLFVCIQPMKMSSSVQQIFENEKQDSSILFSNWKDQGP